MDTAARIPFFFPRSHLICKGLRTADCSHINELECLNINMASTAVRCGFDSRSIRGAGSQRSKFGDRRQSFDLKSPSVRLKASSGPSREMTVRSRAWGVLSLEPNVPSESTCVYSAEISVLRKAARVRCSSTPVRLESPRKLSAGNGREFLGSGSFLSTVVRSEVAGRSVGIDWRRGFDPIDRSISVDSRTIFSSLIH